MFLVKKAECPYPKKGAKNHHIWGFEIVFFRLCTYEWVASSLFRTMNLEALRSWWHQSPFGVSTPSPWLVQVLAWASEEGQPYPCPLSRDASIMLPQWQPNCLQALLKAQSSRWGSSEQQNCSLWTTTGEGNGTTPVFLPGESHGQRSLGGSSPQGSTESDMI